MKLNSLQSLLFLESSSMVLPARSTILYFLISESRTFRPWRSRQIQTLYPWYFSSLVLFPLVKDLSKYFRFFCVIWVPRALSEDTFIATPTVVRKICLIYFLLTFEHMNSFSNYHSCKVSKHNINPHTLNNSSNHIHPATPLHVVTHLFRLLSFIIFWL